MATFTEIQHAGLVAIDRDLGSPALDRGTAGRRFLAAPTMEVESVGELPAELDRLRGRGA